MLTAVLKVSKKSSYAYLNGKTLNVAEAVGRRVSVKLTAKEMGEQKAAEYLNGETIVDFTLAEVCNLRY